MLLKMKRIVTVLTLITAVTIAAQGVLKQAQATSAGIWISPSRLAALPTSGAAWTALVNVATAPAVPGNPTLVDQDSMHSRNTMSTALVAARLDSDALRAKVRDALKLIKGTENSTDLTANRLLQLGRNMPGYVIAADLIGLRAFDPTFDAIFRTWISAMRTRVFSGTYKTLANGDEHDPANWGAYDGAARAAIAAYLGDNVDLARSAAAFKSFVSGVGDSRWSFRPDIHDMSWQCTYPTVSGYTPIDAACTRDSHNLDGFMAQDMARAGGYQWPPIYTAYPRENLNGRTIQAEILFRAGYTDVYQWGNKGLLRAAQAARRLDAVDGRWFDPTQLAYRILATRYNITSWGLSAASRGRSVSGVDWTNVPTASSALIDAPISVAPAVKAPAATPTPAPAKVQAVATPTPAPASTPKPVVATPAPTDKSTPSPTATAKPGTDTAPGQQKKSPKP
jgi:hypothetical protein